MSVNPAPSRNGAAERVILVGYDGSGSARAALDYAVRKAARTDRIVIAHAFADVPESEMPSVLRPAVAEHRRKGQALLDAIPLEGHDDLIEHDYETQLLDGSAPDAISRLAEAIGADEIVVGSRGLNPLRALLGSTSRDLLAHAGRPVTVVPASAGTEAAGPPS
jgi:nucleotide-binding universal stress UspA family protein